MKHIYFLNLCECGCNSIIYGNNHFIRGHNAFINNPMNNIKSRTKISLKKKGRHPWNFGLNKFTDERVKKNSENISTSMKGNNPWDNFEDPDEVKRKLSEVSIKNKIKPPINYGCNNVNWKGGISKLPYCERWTERVREEVRNKYNRKCFLCNKSEEEQMKEQEINRKRRFKLSVHHIDYDKEQGCNGKEFELVPLCLKCHGKIIKNNYFYDWFIRAKLEGIT